MPEWRMLVWQPDGTARATINVDGPVARLDRFDVNGAGNCLEASWVADPQAVTIKARDVIRLDARELATDAWTSVYKGFVTIAGSSRAESLQDYQAVGLKQRLHEILLEEAVISGADVATMVDSAMTTITLPTGVTYSSTNVPTLNFQLGDRYPALETVGDFLEALAATVGRFIVPTGSSYTYDGVTYDPGDIVPAAKWGVDGNGAFFFRRPQATAVSVSEGEVGTRIRWERTSGEQVYDNVTLIYATEYSKPTAFWSDTHEGEPIPYPIAKAFGSGSYEATRRITLDAPADHMTDTASQRTVSNVTNPGNAFDNDDNTYAEFPSDGTSGVLSGEITSPIHALGRIVYAKGAVDEVVVLNAAWVSGTVPFTEHQFLQYDLTDKETTNKIELWLPFPQPAQTINGAADRFIFEVRAIGQGLKLYSLELYTPDAVVGQRLAEAYTIDPVDNASEVELVGQLGDVSQTMNLTPEGEAAADVDVERIEVGLSNDQGLITRYLLAQSFSADLISQRIVLERLVRNAQT